MTGGHAPWYLDQFTGKGFAAIGPDGMPDTNAEWNSYYVNPADKRWRKRVLREVDRFRNERGFVTALYPNDQEGRDLKRMPLVNCGDLEKR